MLLVFLKFLILFTNVLAYSEEDKYVDLLPDAEKQQFIEKVARRILKDVQSEENGAYVASGEMPDDQLQKHTDYVKAILKEEAAYIRRNKAEEKVTGKPASEEKQSSDLKSLGSEKMLSDSDPDEEQLDLTLRNIRRDSADSGDSPTDYIKVEIITDNPPIIKRSVQQDTVNKEIESEESTSETLAGINSVTEESDKVVANESIKNSTEIKVVTNLVESGVVTSTTDAKLVLNSTKAPTSDFKMVAPDLIVIKNKSLSKEEPLADKIINKSNDSKNVNTQKDLQVIDSTTLADQDEEIELVESNNSGSGESDTDAILVKGIDEPWLRRSNSDSLKSAEKTTESEITTTAVEYSGVNSSENHSGDYNTVSSADEKVTTSTYSFKNTTHITTETATTKRYTTEKGAIESNKIETSTTDNAEAKSTIIENITTDGKVMNKNASDITDFVTENTLTTTLTDEETTESFIKTTSFKSSKEISLTTEVENSILNPVPMNEDMKIIDEEYKSADNVTTNTDSVTPKPKRKKSKKKTPKKENQTYNFDETSTKTQESKEKSGAVTPKKIKHKVAYKKEKVNRAPKDSKGEKVIKRNKADANNKNLIELEKVYYDNNYKVKSGKQYHVYEIPADKSPFVKEETPAVDQPYYVPIYNYSPNNAYFNPMNRLGPNPGDKYEDIEKGNIENVGVFSVDDSNVLPLPPYNEGLHEQSVDYVNSAVYIKRKKFGNKHKFIFNGIHKQPKFNNESNKTSGNLNPDDYLDSDYYFGRIRKDTARRVSNGAYYPFPNSDETDHPSHSIQEGNLKDHVRAVRNILFHQKSFGLLEKDKYTDADILRLGSQNKASQEVYKKIQALRINPNDDEVKSNSKKSMNKNEGIAIDYYFGREQNPVTTKDIKTIDISNKYFQKVGYLKDQNKTSELYVMDDIFKDNVKHIKDFKDNDETYLKVDVMTATPHPLPGKKRHLQQTRAEKINNFRGQEKQRNEHIIKISAINEAHKKFLRYNDETQDEFPIPSLASTNFVAKDNKLNITDMGSKDSDTDEDKYRNKKKITNNVNSKQSLKEINTRQNNVVKISVYLQVLKDIISSIDNNALKQYDWLGTTVDIQSALQKLFELIDLVVNGEDIHPGDKEILRYVVFLHKLASEIIEANDFGSQLRKKLLPRNKKKKLKPRMVKQKGLINRVWLYLRREVQEVTDDGALKDLNTFLMDIEDGLFELHDAVKHIAKITKFKRQQWYQNLKDLYISTDDKQLLEIMLHMTTLRLFSLIEESAKNGLEDNYIKYMKNHRKEAKRTLDEMIFVMQILAEYNKIVK